MIRAAVIAVLMLTAAVTGAVAFDHYRPKPVSVSVASPATPEVPNQGAAHRHRQHKEGGAQRKKKQVVHKSLLGKRYPGDDSANELNLRELR